MKKLSDFDCFQSLCRELLMIKRTIGNEQREYELNSLINTIFSQKETNGYWIRKIIDYINFNDDNCNIKEPILLNKTSKDNRPSCLIISKNTINHELTHEDILDMKLGMKKPDYIIYDYKINPNQDMNEYYNRQRSLREVLESVGLPQPIKFFLCEDTMAKLKDKEQKSNRKKRLTIIRNNNDN